MLHPYKIMNLKISLRGARTAELSENGVIIASVKQNAPTKNYIGDFSIKFLSTASKNRFDDFCDCISMQECCEALGFND